MLYIKKANVCFLHIPKTGGTSIRDALCGDDVIYVQHQDHCNIEQACNILMSHKISFKKMVNVKFCAVVRNTYSRLVSLFHHTKRGGNEPNLNFGTFLYRINTRAAGRHTASQLYYIAEKIEGYDTDDTWADSTKYGDIQVHEIFSFDNFDSELTDFFDSKGVKIEIPKLNTSDYGDYTYHDYYSTELKDLVDEMYTDEINRFKFKFREDDDN